MLVSWLGAAGRPALDHAFCRLQRLRLVKGLYRAVVALAMSEVRMTRPFIIHHGSEQAGSEILEMAQDTIWRQDPRSFALCGTCGEGREENHKKCCFLVLVHRSYSHGLLATFGWLLLVKHWQKAIRLFCC